jgi:hypothetical protein
MAIRADHQGVEKYSTRALQYPSFDKEIRTRISAWIETGQVSG